MGKSNIIRLERFTTEELEKKVISELNAETLSWVSKRTIYIGKEKFDKIKYDAKSMLSMWDSTIKTVTESVFKSFQFKLEIEKSALDSMPSCLIKVENILVFQGEEKNVKDTKQVKKSLKKRLRKNLNESPSCFPFLFCYVIAGEKIQLYVLDRSGANKTELIELSRTLCLSDLNDQVEAVKCFTNIALIVSGFFNTD